jgi:putative hydrolase of the HAD superfamily
MPLRRQDLQAVTFDVGGTLIECWPSVGHIYADVAARHTNKLIPAEMLNRRFAAAWRAHADFQHTRADWAALVDSTFAGLLELPPSQTFFELLYQRFSEPAAWHIFEDVTPTLETLKARGVRLGVISNWDERLRPLLRDLQLADYFDVVVVSCEVGASKPGPGIFAAALQKLAVPPHTILHVGDSLEMDVQGAQAVGLDALWLRRGAPPGQGSVASLREVAEHLAACGTSS